MHCCWRQLSAKQSRRQLLHSFVARKPLTLKTPALTGAATHFPHLTFRTRVHGHAVDLSYASKQLTKLIAFLSLCSTSYWVAGFLSKNCLLPCMIC